MNKNIATVFFLASLLISIVNAQPGKPRGKRPADFSWGAGNGQSNGTQVKYDSLTGRKSKNEVAIETTERRNANGSSGVKLDDLKNPFDTGKVRTPAVNRTGKPRRQPIKN